MQQKGKTIMAHNCRVTQAILRRQSDTFREAARRGITHKALHLDADVSLSGLGQWARGETVMGPVAREKLEPFLGLELMSMLLPDGQALVGVPDGIDHHEFAKGVREYLEMKAAAHHPDSEDGEAISEGEARGLDAKVTQIGAVA